MLGNPKYKHGDYVVFQCMGKVFKGYVYIVDAFGTFGQSEEASYDIMSTRNGEECLYKHIRESMVLHSITRTVLCYIERDNKYLMLLRNKRENDMNSGKWLGIGGHVEYKESPDDAVVREVKEETGLVLENFTLRGLLYFVNDDYIEAITLYTSNQFSGNITSCDEGTLSWIDKDKLMDLNMWEGDREFLPILMGSDSYFEMKLYYKKGKFIRSEVL